MTDLRLVSSFLEINITWIREFICLDQKSYLEMVLL